MDIVIVESDGKQWYATTDDLSRVIRRAVQRRWALAVDAPPLNADVITYRYINERDEQGRPIYMAEKVLHAD